MKVNAALFWISLWAFSMFTEYIYQTDLKFIGAGIILAVIISSGVIVWRQSKRLVCTCRSCCRGSNRSKA